MLFRDMEPGQWFRDDFGVVLMKLTTGTAFVSKVHMSMEVPPRRDEAKGSLAYPVRNRKCQKSRYLKRSKLFNCVDLTGEVHFCPDWVEFDTLDSPRFVIPAIVEKDTKIGV